jgi:hypothetical protein
MGETRGGKSEIGKTISINYKRIFNKLFELGHFDDVNLSTGSDEIKVKRSKINFTVDHIRSDAGDYMYQIREKARSGTFIFGEKYLIDEDKDSIGGVGSFSEAMDIQNLNNIVAKFMISETWIKPNQFLQRNTPYGIHCFIKDEKQRLNWGLLYKIEMKSAGVQEKTLLGWVGIGLHKDKKLRADYDKKKNQWIYEEYKGSPGKRVKERHKAAEILAEEPLFCETTITKAGNLKFVKSTEQQKVVVEKLMLEGTIPNFNETEIERIINHARLIVEEKEVKKE